MAANRWRCELRGRHLETPSRAVGLGAALPGAGRPLRRPPRQAGSSSVCLGIWRAPQAVVRAAALTQTDWGPDPGFAIYELVEKINVKYVASAQ